MNKKKYSPIALVVLAFLLACQFLTRPLAGAEEPPAKEQPVPTFTETSPAENPSSPLVGLTYRVYQVVNSQFQTSRQEVWQFGSDGKATKVFEGDHITSGVIFSPDGMQMVYADFGPAQDRDSCVWHVDYESKTISQATCGGDRRIIGWIPGQADKLLSASVPDIQTGDGNLEVISLSGGTVEELESATVGASAISSDGSVAYDNASSYGEGALGRLFRWESGVEDFKPQDYGVNYPTIDNPAWSPDGKKIAWGLKDGFRHAFGVFDLADGTGLALHPYERAPSMRNSSEPASWSPDGKWLAASICVYNGQSLDGNDPCDPEKSGIWFMSVDNQSEFKFDGEEIIGWSPDSQWVFYTVEAEATSETILWVSKLDGGQATQLGSVSFPNARIFWSPDGKHLAFMDVHNSIVLAEVGTWTVSPLITLEAPSNPSEKRQFIQLIGWFDAILPAFDSLPLTESTP